MGAFWSTNMHLSPAAGLRLPPHAPGVPACWPMRGSPPSTASWPGVVSCSAVMTMVFSSTSSQVGLEKADRGRVILCISRSYTRCSCCFFKSRPLETNTAGAERRYLSVCASEETQQATFTILVLVAPSHSYLAVIFKLHFKSLNSFMTEDVVMFLDLCYYSAKPGRNSLLVSLRATGDSSQIYISMKAVAKR